MLDVSFSVSPHAAGSDQFHYGLGGCFGCVSVANLGIDQELSGISRTVSCLNLIRSESKSKASVLSSCSCFDSHNCRPLAPHHSAIR